MNWLSKIREKLDFSAIPEVLSFQDGCAVASLVDGFDLAGGTLESFAIGNRIVSEMFLFGQTKASALDTWIALHGWVQASGIPSF